MHLLRRDVRLNDVNWSLVATSLLGNSGYQTDRKIYDQSKMTLHLATGEANSDRFINLAHFRSLLDELFPAVYTVTLSSTTLISVFST